MGLVLVKVSVPAKPRPVDQKAHQMQQPSLHSESYPSVEKGEAVKHHYEAEVPVDQNLGKLMARIYPLQYDVKGNTFKY